MDILGLRPIYATPNSQLSMGFLLVANLPQPHLCARPRTTYHEYSYSGSMYRTVARLTNPPILIARNWLTSYPIIRRVIVMAPYGHRSPLITYLYLQLVFVTSLTDDIFPLYLFTTGFRHIPYG